MKIGIGIGLTTRQGVSGEPPIITATVAPSLGPLDDGDTIASAMSANYDQASNYSSAAGTISTVVAAATVNGVAALFTDTVDAGDVVAVTVTVTDSEANERVFNAGSRTVADVAPVASGAIADQSYTEGLEITPLDVSEDFTGTRLTFALAPSSAALPGGLSLSSAGVISGTPTTVAAEVNIVVRATNSAGTADTAFGVTIAEASAFTPASLFASGEEGAWYEPSPTTCFTDTAGTTPAAVGDSVARINDLSGNGNHATQATAAARPILARVPPRGRVNELSETDALATQSVTVTAAQRTLSFTGTGTVTLTGASTAGPLVGTGAGDRVSLTFTPSAGSLTLTVLGTVTDAQLELGASATTYQFVADSLGYDITEAGVADLYYLSFDGSDDWMALPNIPFSSDTGFNAFMGADTSDLQSSYRVAFSRGADNGVYSAGTYFGGIGGNSYKPNLYDQGSSQAVNVLTRNKAVFAWQSSLTSGSTRTVITRVNQSQVLTSYSRTPTNNEVFTGLNSSFGAQIARVNIYSAILRCAAPLTAQEISDTETYLASKSGVTL